MKSFLNLLYDSSVKVASWPEIDVTRLIQKEPIKERARLSILLEKEKTKFEMKFCGKKPRDSFLDEDDVSSSTINEKNDDTRPLSEILSVHENYIEEIIKECNLSMKDPLLDAYEKINNQISCKKLFFLKYIILLQI